MSVVVLAQRLRQEMARRGWSSSDLARHARLANATVSAALAGRPIAPASLAQIAKALSEAPVIDAIDDLLAPSESHRTVA